MGWNSWNWFAGKVTDADIRKAADLIVSSGMLPVPAVGGHVAVHGHDVRVVAVRTSYTRSDDEGVPLLFTRVTVAAPR